MKRSRFTEAQIVGVLKQAEAGVAVKDLCRKLGVSDQTFYNWKAKYAGLSVSDLKRLKELEAENARLKKMYADLALENEAIKGVLNRKLQRRPNAGRPLRLWSGSIDCRLPGRVEQPSSLGRRTTGKGSTGRSVMRQWSMR